MTLKQLADQLKGLAEELETFDQAILAAEEAARAAADEAMRQAGRTDWNWEDYNLAVRVVNEAMKGYEGFIPIFLLQPSTSVSTVKSMKGPRVKGGHA